MTIPKRKRGRQKGWRKPDGATLTEQISQFRIRKDTLDWLKDQAASRGATASVISVIRDIIEQAQQADQKQLKQE
jgi:hypothetical protein